MRKDEAALLLVGEGVRSRRLIDPFLNVSWKRPDIPPIAQAGEEGIDGLHPSGNLVPTELKFAQSGVVGQRLEGGVVGDAEEGTLG